MQYFIKIKKVAKKMAPGIYAKLFKIKSDRLLKLFKRKHPETKVFETLNDLTTAEFNRKLHSQSNQDYIVHENFFKDKKDGFFCDIGGNHPLKINNTLHFEELGWNGCVFEPLSHMEPLWKKHRRAKFFPYAASDTNGQTTFIAVKDKTGWEDMFSFIKETGSVEIDCKTEDIVVETRILREVFKEEGIKHIDYMSIDVEGHELKVIKGIDFNEVRINVLTIENNIRSFNGAKNSKKIRNIMQDNNYKLWGRIIDLDDIYVHKDFINAKGL